MALFQEFDGTQQYQLGSATLSPDGRNFYVIASVTISVDSGGNLLSLDRHTDSPVGYFCGMTFTINDDNGERIRVVDSIPYHTTRDQNEGIMRISFFGSMAFVPTGESPTLSVGWWIGVGGLTDFDTMPLGDVTWTGTVTITPDASETENVVL